MNALHKRVMPIVENATVVKDTLTEVTSELTENPKRTNDEKYIKQT